MNEVVKYDNYMNGLRFSNFTQIDLNFLMALCSKMRDKGTDKICLSFEQLKELTDYKKSNSIKQFVSDLEKMNEKLMKVTCKLKTETETVMFVLFPTFRIDIKNQVLIVSVNEDFEFILNEITSGFTRFDLGKFVELESKYAKNLYRLLKQYKTTGRYETSVEIFREKMDGPKSYSNKQFMQNIVNPAVESLQKYFSNLKCNVQYARKQGRPVTGYVFTFDPEQRNTDEKLELSYKEKKSVTPISEKKHKVSKTTNRFCQFEQHTYSKEEMDAIEKAMLRNSERCLQK